MKRIKVLLFFISFLYSNSLWAEEIVITLCCGNNDGHRVEDRRSISLTPTATIDGSTIRIYSVIIIDNMQITVKDQSGNTVYSATTTLFQDTPYSFVIPNSEDETYQLQLSSSSTLFNGTFQVE